MHLKCVIELKKKSGWGVNGFPEFCPLTITKAEYDK